MDGTTGQIRQARRGGCAYAGSGCLLVIAGVVVAARFGNIGWFPVYPDGPPPGWPPDPNQVAIAIALALAAVGSALFLVAVARITRDDRRPFARAEDGTGANTGDDE